MFTLKLFRGTPSQFGLCATKPSQSLARVKFQGPAPLRAEIEYSEKVHLGGSTCAPITFLLVDQSSPSVFRPMVDEM